MKSTIKLTRGDRLKKIRNQSNYLEQNITMKTQVSQEDCENFKTDKNLSQFYLEQSCVARPKSFP